MLGSRSAIEWILERYQIKTDKPSGIVNDPNAWGGRHAAAWLADQAIVPTVLCDLDALEAIALLVADGMGASLVPQWVGIERFAGDCLCLPISAAAYARCVVMVSPAESDCAQMVQVLQQALAPGPLPR